MKIHLHNDDGVNLINSYAADHAVINGQPHYGNLLVTASDIVTGWAPAGFDHLAAADFETVLTLRPAVILIGTGSRQRFPAAEILRPLIDANTGFEIMDTPAACRTYNLLISEKRAVAAALLFDPPVA